MNCRKFALCALLALSLAACGGRAAVETATLLPPPSSGPASATAAAATLAPTLTELAVPSASQPPTATPAPSDTPAATGSPADTPAITATPAEATSTPGGPAGTYRADFVEDVTVPDGTSFKPGETFVKTWKLKNAGTAPWGTDFFVVNVKGDTFGSPAAVPLSSTVRPGETVDLSLTFTAPDKLGSYTSFWMLRTPAGAPFGIGQEGNQPFYVQINVGSEGGTPVATAPAGSITVTVASLTLDTPEFTGACPHTFTFTASFTSEGAGDVNYKLEAEADDPAFTFTLPEAVKSTFTGAGPRTFTASYQLQFTNSVGGQAWLHILTPNDLQSDKVRFSLTCQP